MFFIASKLFALLLKPFNWVVLLLLAAWWKRRNPALSRRLLVWSVGLVLIFTNPLIINLLARAWESGQTGTPSARADVGIVLGGFVDMEAMAPEGMVQLHRSGNRLTTALQFYHTGRIRYILISGGAGRLVGSAPAEAPVAKQFLLQAGVPDSAIWVEDQSRNTRENAVFSKKLLDEKLPGARCLLFTSAWHMRRALGCYRKVGIACDPLGTDFFGEKSNGNVVKWVEPNGAAIHKWESLLKEWIGWIVYRVKGYV